MRNLQMMRQFYRIFSNANALRSELSVVGSDPNVRCYYPEKISLTIDDHESVTFMTEGNIISEKWVEEGWDFVNDCATGEYKFYNKVIIRDFDGIIISEEMGSIHQAPDGSYWVS